MKRAEHNERVTFLQLNGCVLVSKQVWKNWPTYWAWYFPEPHKPGSFRFVFDPIIEHNGEKLYHYEHSSNKFTLTKQAYDYYIDMYHSIS